MIRSRTKPSRNSQKQTFHSDPFRVRPAPPGDLPSARGFTEIAATAANIMDELVTNFSDANEKRAFLAKFGAMQGTYRIEYCHYRARRSDRQNRFYWPCFCEPFAEFRREQGEGFTKDDAHEFFKIKFLSQTVVDFSTGEVDGITVRSTTTLTTSDFNEYLDKIAAWLNQKIGFTFPDPSIYHETDGGGSDFSPQSAGAEHGTRTGAHLGSEA